MQVYRIDENKFFLEDVELLDGESIPSDCREDKPANGFIRPKRNESDTGWIEGATQEEINAVNKGKQVVNEVDILREKIAAQDTVIEELMFTIIPEITGGGM